MLTAALFIIDRGENNPNAQKPTNEKKVRPVGSMGISRCKKEGRFDRSCDIDNLEDVELRETSQAEKGPATTRSLGRATSVPREPKPQRRDTEWRRPLNEWRKW